MTLRRAGMAGALAASAMLLLGCASAPALRADPGPLDHAAADAERLPIGVEPSVEVADDGVLTVTTPRSAWTLEVLEAGPVDLGDLGMFDGSATAEEPPGGSVVGWVCVRATQLEGDPGAWMSDDVRLEVWATPEGPRYDDLTGFAYEPADGALDVYEASGNDLGVPYERVCPIFVVPADVDLSTIAVVPSGGEPVVLER
ncbi:hypothetical protein GCM10009846_18090 [Agrococcus versicolor]|uniref:Secreted protein n=1 Tax=Agrococcus versicolor TaxID=501482 RepID=A0ABP5MH39_9MICO